MDNNIEQFKDIHKNKPGFILGNGPSLGRTPLHLLDSEITFCVNAFYQFTSGVGIPDLKSGMKSTYYAVSCARNLARYYPDIFKKVNCPIFLSHTAGVLYLSDDKYSKARSQDIFIIPTIGSMDALWIKDWKIRDVAVGTYWARTVVMDTCVPLAHYMGLDPVCMLGCDCYWEGQHYADPSVILPEPPSETVVNEIFKCYKIFKEGFEETGRELLNCTISGALKELKRSTIEKVLEK